MKNKEANNTIINAPVSKERKSLFNNVLKNMRTSGATKDGKPIKGNVFIPLELLFVDNRYQGFRKHKRIKKLHDNWDICKLGDITVVPHYETCTFAIVDGQGRFIVATELGLEGLDAVVLLAAPDDPAERLIFEASFFIDQDSECENLKQVEKHLALSIKGNPAALAIDELIEKYGITIVNTTGQRGESIIGSYCVAYKIACKPEGKECLDFVFAIIQNAAWNKAENGYARYIVRSLSDIYFAHKDEKVRERIFNYLSKEMRYCKPMEFRANSVSKYPKRDKNACTLYLEDMICENLGIARFIYPKGDNGIEIYVA